MLYRLCFFVVFCFSTFVFLRIYSDHRKNDLQNLSSIVVSTPLKLASDSSQLDKPLFAGETVSFEFITEYSNFGTVGVVFQNFGKRQIGTARVELSNLSTNEILYSADTPTDKMTWPNYYTLGWPIIKNSKNQHYKITITSLDGTSENAIAVAKNDNVLLKHIFPKKQLLSNPTLLLELMSFKMSELTSALKKTPMQFWITWIIIYFFSPLMWKKFIKKRKKITPIIVFLVVLLTSGYFSFLESDPHHDGIVFKPALDVARGQMLYSETFTQYGALTTLLQSGIILLFGEHLYLLKLFTAVTYSFIGVLLYLIGAKFLNQSQNMVICTVWLLLAPYLYSPLLPWSSIYALFFQLCTIHFFLKYIEKNEKRFSILTGLTLILGFWSKLNVGAYIGLGLISSLIFIQVFQKKDASFLLQACFGLTLGAFLGSIPILLWIYSNQAFEDWYKQTFLFSYFWIKEYGRNISLSRSLFAPSESVISIWSLIPAISIFVFLKEIVKKNKNITLIVIGFFSLFSWLQYHPINDPRHTYWATTPMLPLVAVFFYSILNIYPKKGKKEAFLGFLLSTIIISGIFLEDVLYRAKTAAQRISYSKNTIDSSTSTLRYMKMPEVQAFHYIEIETAISNYQQKYEKTPVVNLTSDALYSAMSSTQNFHPMHVNWELINSNVYPDFANERTTFININRPLVISCDSPSSAISSYCPISQPSSWKCVQVYAPCEKLP